MIATSISTRSQRVLQTITSIAMMIANEYLNRDESHERASSDATRVAMEYCTIATRVAMNNRILIRESEGSPMQGDLLGRINEIN
jgi:hypothetical protein